MAREGKHYIGFDLPVVADEIGAIVKGLIPDDLSALVEYHGVDATNYDSMRRHLDQVKGEVCIATDGLLGYFNESELNSMCVNIKRILREFGGSWITGDMTNEVIFGATFGILLKSNPEALQTFSMNTASQMADVAMKQIRRDTEGGGIPAGRRLPGGKDLLCRPDAFSCIHGG